MGRDSGRGIWDKMVREGLYEDVAFERGRVGRACQAEGRARLEAEAGASLVQKHCL